MRFKTPFLASQGWSLAVQHAWRKFRQRKGIFRQYWRTARHAKGILRQYWRTLRHAGRTIRRAWRAGDLDC